MESASGGFVIDGGRRVRLLLLRHGQVANHRGDVPLTELGVAQAVAAGRGFARAGIEIAALLSGETERTKQSAAAFQRGSEDEGMPVSDPVVSFALRNPDLYLGGHRINLAEGAEALAAQSPSVLPSDVESSPFYGELMQAKDRVGYWLTHGNPPGDTARDVGVRVDRFARSLADVPDWAGQTIVAITHSPVLRAVRFHHQGDYTREPPFLHGYELMLGVEGGLSLTAFATDTGDLETTARPGPGVVRAEGSGERA